MYKILRPYGNIKVFVFLYSLLILGRIADIYMTHVAIVKFFGGNIEKEGNPLVRGLLRNIGFWGTGFIQIIFVVSFLLLFTFLLYKNGLNKESSSLPLSPQSSLLYGIIFIISASFALAWWNGHPSSYWITNNLDFTAEKLVQKGIVQTLSDQRSVWVVMNVTDLIGAVVVLIVIMIVIIKIVKKIQNSA